MIIRHAVRSDLSNGLASALKDGIIGLVDYIDVYCETRNKKLSNKKPIESIETQCLDNCIGIVALFNIEE